MTALIHIAGRALQVNDRIRQRCAWCGTVLSDYDLTRVMVPEGQPGPPAMWPEGEFIAVDGGASWTEPHTDGAKLPEGSCALIDDDVTA
jgi:hypothetical protein